VKCDRIICQHWRYGRNKRLTLAALGCQSVTYVCSQLRLLDTRQQRNQPINERVTRLCL